jgi:hypothetical protein
MSAPARHLAPARRPSPARTRPGTRTGAEPVRRTNGGEPARRHPPTVRRTARAVRRRHRLGFAVFASALVGPMVLGIVVLHALLAQQSFRIAEAEGAIEDLGLARLELVRAQATLSAPGRIAAWATRHDMRLPDDIRILRAPEGSGGPAGAGTATATVRGRASSPAEDG